MLLLSWWHLPTRLGLQRHHTGSSMTAPRLSSCLKLLAARPSFNELDRRLGSLDASIFPKAEVKATAGDTLLESVFPKHVAKALKEGRKVRGLRALSQDAAHECRS